MRYSLLRRDFGCEGAEPVGIAGVHGMRFLYGLGLSFPRDDDTIFVGAKIERAKYECGCGEFDIRFRGFLAFSDDHHECHLPASAIHPGGSGGTMQSEWDVHL
jgi:hypothetical protein